MLKRREISSSLILLLIFVSLMFLTVCDEERASIYEIIRITDYYDTICPGEKFAPICSPIDNRVAFIGLKPNSDYETIWTFDMETLEYICLDALYIDCAPMLSWSQDGKYILYSTDDYFEGKDYILYYISSNNKQQMLEPIKVETPEGHEPRHPDWSPDGEWIVYNNNADGYIWKIKLDGSEPTIITEGECPRWSPDGTRIVYIDDSDSDFNNIYTIKSDGSEKTLILPGEYRDIYWPDWSPSGEYITFTDESIFIVPSSGGTQIQITDGYTLIYIGHLFPTWTYDEEYIVFWDDISVNAEGYPEYNQLYKINPKLGWGVE